MMNYELHYTLNRQTEILQQTEQERWLQAFRSSQPSLAQRTILAVGEALEQMGSWMKRQASTRSASDMNQGLPVPR